MQLTTLSDQVELKQYSLGDVWQEYDRSSSAHPIPSDHPASISVPIGLAFQTRDGLMYTLRRVSPADAEPLAEFLRGLSAQTRWLRYMTARPCSPDVLRAEVARMLAGAAGDSITLIVTAARGGSEAVAAVAELVCDRARGTGEVGLVVSDDMQRKGIGSLVLRQLLQIGQELGLSQLHGDMVAENYAIQHLIRALGLRYTASLQSGEMHIVVQLPT